MTAQIGTTYVVRVTITRVDVANVGMDVLRHGGKAPERVRTTDEVLDTTVKAATVEEAARRVKGIMDVALPASA